MSLARLLLRHARATPERAAVCGGTALRATHGQWPARRAGLAGLERQGDVESAAADALLAPALRLRLRQVKGAGASTG